MYSYERKKAVDLYIKYGKKASAVNTKLGERRHDEASTIFCTQYKQKD